MEQLPVLTHFKEMITKEAKNLQEFKLELDELSKTCSIASTSPVTIAKSIRRTAGTVPCIN